MKRAAMTKKSGWPSLLCAAITKPLPSTAKKRAVNS
jgi:hypothetical protein